MKGETYEEFVKKFETKKTTDDCYTPRRVYEVVAKWVANEYDLDTNNFIRPFFKAGDYEKTAYSATDVVVDNPPFSILSKIVCFYLEREIKFFLFAPTLTLFSLPCGGCFLPSGVTITYENGAKVNTSFITNLEPQERLIRVAPELFQTVKEADEEQRQQRVKKLPRYCYPNEILTSTMCSSLAKNGVPYVLKRSEACKVSSLDAQAAAKKAIFGSGFLISEKAAAEKAAAEKAAAEKAAAIVWELSEREKEIIRGLEHDSR